jgi:Domain of unknown function (DUF222)
VGRDILDRMSETVEWVWDDGPEPAPYIPSVLDAELVPDDVAAWAASVTPGSAVIKPLAVLDPRRLSPEGRVDALAAMERQIAWLHARQHRLIAVMAAEPVRTGGLGEVDKEWVKEDIACALKLSASTAADRLRQATELSRLPAALDLLERGELTGHHTRALAENTLGEDDATATAIEKSVLAKAAGQSLANFRRALRKALLTAAPKTAEQRHQQGVADRRVVCTPRDNGISEIWMSLADADAATFMTAVHALARLIRPMTPAPPINAEPTPSFRWRWTPCTAPAVTNYPANTACGPPSRSVSPCPPCSAWTSNPVNWPDTARSPPK